MSCWFANSQIALRVTALTANRDVGEDQAEGQPCRSSTAACALEPEKAWLACISYSLLPRHLPQSTRTLPVSPGCPRRLVACCQEVWVSTYILAQCTQPSTSRAIYCQKAKLLATTCFRTGKRYAVTSPLTGFLDLKESCDHYVMLL